ELLHLALERRNTFGFLLERKSKLKLKIVDKPHARGRRRLARQFGHELEPLFECWKQDRAIFLNFRKGKNLDDGRRDDAERSLRTKHQSPQIHSCRLARRRAHPLQSPSRGDDVHIEDEIFDVAVSVLLHAAGVGGDPATQRGELDTVWL